jgi:glycine cleavage system H protein
LLYFLNKEATMHPEDIRYHKEHTWVRVSGNKGTIGITDYAQDALGDIVYVDLPELDSSVEASTEITEIESTKSTSSVISPVSGRVIAINEELSETPEIINEDPYERGWIAVIELDNPAEIDDLLDASEYGKLVDEEST